MGVKLARFSCPEFDGPSPFSSQSTATAPQRTSGSTAALANLCHATAAQWAPAPSYTGLARVSGSPAARPELPSVAWLFSTASIPLPSRAVPPLTAARLTPRLPAS